MTMRRARLFDGVDESRGPYFAEHRARIEDPQLRELLSEFLNGGTIVRRTTFRDIDRMDPSRGNVVPTSTITDGEWIWNAGLTYYLVTHHITPEPEFMAYIATQNYQASSVDRLALREALDVLQRSAAR